MTSPHAAPAQPPVQIIDPAQETGLSPEQNALFNAFARLNINAVTYRHIPVFTVGESDFLKDHIPGTHGKSLLLTAKKGGFWMVSAADETKIDLKYLSDKLETPRFSFAKPEQMAELLRVTPGSLTPFAAMFDTQNQVQVILDDHLMQQEYCVFHPLINIYSTALKTADLQRFLTAHGHTPHVTTLSAA